jgi:hypothetical protein
VHLKFRPKLWTKSLDFSCFTFWGQFWGVYQKRNSVGSTYLLISKQQSFLGESSCCGGAARNTECGLCGKMLWRGRTHHLFFVFPCSFPFLSFFVSLYGLCFFVWSLLWGLLLASSMAESSRCFWNCSRNSVHRMVLVTGLYPL